MPSKKFENKTRSGAYQWYLLESPFDFGAYVNMFSNQDSWDHQINPFVYDEKGLELRDKLTEEFWRLAKEKMTPRQWEVSQLMMQGMTQMEMAKALNVNQSSITKCIFGNTCYHKGKSTCYGGLIKKMKRAVANDPIIQALLREITNELEEKL